MKGEQLLKKVVNEFGATPLGREEIYDADIDIYSPCALGATLDDDTIPRLKCSIVAGAANNQLKKEEVHSKMLKDKKILFYLLVILYLGIGIYLSITTGITSDESFEQLNWDKNVSGIISLLNFGHYDEFLRYLDKYHGIAFHYFSQPIQLLTNSFVEKKLSS